MLETLARVVRNLQSRNIQAVAAADLDEAQSWILDKIPRGASIGFGNSETLKAIGLSRLLTERGDSVFDKTTANDREESARLKRLALTADWFIAGANAVSHDGHIVNIDHSGNRVAGLLYGPRRVVLLIGRNKIVPTLEDAIHRARNVAAPQNARRAGMSPPCVELGRCVDCRSEQRVCNSLVVIEGQADPERMYVVLVNEELGF
jgi:L-lactate utilization protein LutB